MRLFLTGGSGLVGSHVAERLRSSGHDVVALVRPSSDTRHLEGLGAELRTGDVTDSPQAHAARIADCAGVVHAAAVVFRRVDVETTRRVNVTGTEHVLRGSALAGVRRVVHVSSVAVYGGSLDRPPLREEDWLQGAIPADAGYARSKRDAERLAWKMHGAGDVELTTVRPGVVYGERDRAFSPIMARVVRWPVLPLPGGGRRTVALVYAGSVATAIETIVRRPNTSGRAYNLAADSRLTAREVVRFFSRSLGHNPRIVPLPGRPLVAAAAAGDFVVRNLPGVPFLRLRREVERLLRDNMYDSSRARRELDWGPVLRPEDAIDRTAEWLRKADVENG